MITRKGRATRDRIVAAAAVLVYERGVAGTSTEDMQAAAGVSASQLYHYSLIRAAHPRGHRISGRRDPRVSGPMLARLDSLAALRSWAAAIVDIQRSNGFRGGCPLGWLASELAENNSAARENVVAGNWAWQAAIRGGLAAIRDRGRLLDSADVDGLATASLTSLQGGLLLAKALRDGEPLETALSTAIDHVATFAAE